MKIGLDSSVLVASVKKVGEPYHASSLKLSHRISQGDSFSVASALVLLEVPSALTSSTRMPIEKIYEVAAPLQDAFKLRIMDFENYTDLAGDLIFELRELKSRLEIPSADFHHVATSIREGCDLFVTTDERHILRPECRSRFERHIKIADPDEASERAVVETGELSLSPLNQV
ncbi:type II toxin-antitoxin system VapC family toxin [Candidatus Bathyarchaeota archaeon]|nr:type II toxin-antitoxin system VapC family toxin [Candidatus Bathyarchaeota archaeon]